MSRTTAIVDSGRRGELKTSNSCLKSGTKKDSEQSRIEAWIKARKSWLDKENQLKGMLRQKARIKWDIEGDENSKFFHSVIKRRNNKSNIRGLMVNGLWCEDPYLIKAEVVKHYKTLWLEEAKKGGTHKKFTRASDDGLKFSKLDRFLLNEEFVKLWGNTSVVAVALDRKLSNHCPIVLKDVDLDFGPKPFRAFDIWLEERDIRNVVEEAWKIEVMSRQPDCRFRDKLKTSNSCLKSGAKKDSEQ
ncbi:hypothetical protein Tco_0303531 [Tanacetum coccineum]